MSDSWTRDEPVLMIDESYLPISLYVPSLTDERFRELCEQYEDFQVEYTADGELVIMALTDIQTSVRNAKVTASLGSWADATRRGFVTASSAGFVLPNQARRSADAAWMTRDRLGQSPTCPQFVIELLSPVVRRKMVLGKMVEWIENGAELGWMIDADRRTVSIYRPNRDVEVREGILEIAGEGPVAGFVLDLREIWNIGPFD